MEDGVMILLKTLTIILAIGVLPMAVELCKTVWKDINIYSKVCLFTVSMAMVLSAWAMLYCCFK